LNGIDKDTEIRGQILVCASGKRILLLDREREVDLHFGQNLSPDYKITHYDRLSTEIIMEYQTGRMLATDAEKLEEMGFSTSDISFYEHWTEKMFTQKLGVDQLYDDVSQRYKSISLALEKERLGKVNMSATSKDSGESSWYKKYRSRNITD
jgi:hypothetical protein